METIEERTRFLRTFKFGFGERGEINVVLEWLTDDPETAAAYIVWLEHHIAETTVRPRR